jgi:hypothetical protein
LWPIRTTAGGPTGRSPHPAGDPARALPLPS